MARVWKKSLRFGINQGNRKAIFKATGCCVSPTPAHILSSEVIACFALKQEDVEHNSHVTCTAVLSCVKKKK